MHLRRVSHWEQRGPVQLPRVPLVRLVRLLRERGRVLPQALERELQVQVQPARQVLGRVLQVQPEP